jgi:hypothetical protein
VSKPCTPVVHIKIAGKWMFIPLKMVLIGIDPYPYTVYSNTMYDKLCLNIIFIIITVNPLIMKTIIITINK